MQATSHHLSHAEWPEAIDRDERVFNDRLPELLAKHEGQYVAIYRGEVVGHDADDSRLFGRMHAQLGYVHFLIQRVSRETEVFEIE